MQSIEELMRIKKAILEDLGKWDQTQPLEDFIAELLEKRALLDKEEAKKEAQEILRGISEYKEAKEFLKKNPQIIEELMKDKSSFMEIIAKLKSIIESVKIKIGGEKNEQ